MTIAVSVVISGIVALTLSPALAALLLKQQHEEPAKSFRIFNRGFDWLTDRYGSVVAFFLKRTFVSLAVVAAMLAATGLLFSKVPGR